MLLTPTDIRDIHGELGTAEALVDRRRAVYSAVAELVSGRSADGITPDLLDSPVARSHLGEVVVDVGRYRSDALLPLSRLTAGAPEFVSGTAHTAVVTDPDARAPLDPAVQYIESELGRHAAAAAGIRLLLDDDPGFPEAARTVLDGLDIAVKLCPELADDLLPHVALFAVIRNGGTEQLGSASVREYPGLVVVPQPTSPLEVAEALVHEGAHQKFFDLGITCSVVGDDFHAAPSFTSSWAAPSAPGWPLEQCAAAFHAYTCLAAFNGCVEESAFAGRLHEFSLLPHAETRAAELGEWVLANQRFFGPDGRALMSALAGCSRRPALAGGPTEVTMDRDVPTTVRRCGVWTLVAQMGDGVELYWVPSDAPAV
jgi:hypothetical protein